MSASGVTSYSPHTPPHRDQLLEPSQRNRYVVRTSLGRHPTRCLLHPAAEASSERVCCLWRTVAQCGAAKEGGGIWGLTPNESGQEKKPLHQRSPRPRQTGPLLEESDTANEQMRQQIVIQDGCPRCDRSPFQPVHVRLGLSFQDVTPSLWLYNLKTQSLLKCTERGALGLTVNHSSLLTCW